MTSWLEELLLAALVALALVSLHWVESATPEGPQRLLPLHVEAVRRLEVTPTPGTPAAWVRPGEGWLEAEGRDEHVFRVLWEISRLRDDLPQAEAVPVVRTLRLETPRGPLVLELGRLRAGHVVPLRVGSRWVMAPGAVWDALERLLVEERGP